MTNTRVNTWTNIGKNINTTDFSELLEQANLNYTVSTEDAFIKFNNEEIKVPNKKIAVRDDGHIYGFVSENYNIIQNADAFDFINYIDEDIKFIKAGETYNGLVYIIGELPEVNILGDKFIPHIIFQNSFNGGYSLATSICPLRIVCQNQFNIAFKESNSTFLIRHTKNADTKMKIAGDTLRNISHYMNIFNKKAELFASRKVTPALVEKFINHMFPEKEAMTEKALNNLEEEKNKFLAAYNNEDNNNFKGTAWGLINGLTDYITHKEYKRKVENADEKRFIDTILVANNLNTQMDYLQSITA